jgi:hypothetical protein
LALDLVDASHATIGGSGGVSLASGDVITDLHMALGSGGLSLYSTEPPSNLRISGDALHKVMTVRLNGRDIGRPATDSPNELSIRRWDWGENSQEVLLPLGGRDVWNRRDYRSRLPRAR